MEFLISIPLKLTITVFLSILVMRDIWWLMTTNVVLLQTGKWNRNEDKDRSIGTIEWLDLLLFWLNFYV